MASISLTELWLHDEADHAVNVRTYGYVGYGQSVTSGAGQRIYANGRARMVSRGGALKTKTVTFPLADATTVAVLKGWVGRVLMLRDPFGDVLRGFFASYEADALPASAFTTISFTFQEVSITGDV